MDYQRELIKEYTRIARRLDDPNVTEEYLDSLLEVFTHQLSSIEKNKGDYYSSKIMLRNLKKVQDNNKPIIMTEEQKINGALEKLYIVYTEKEDITTRIVKSLEPYLSQVEDLDLNELDIEDDFRDFLGNIIARLRNKPGTNNKKKANKERTAAYKSLMPTHERLNSYFNDNKVKVKTKRPLDEEFNCYYEMNLLLALKNSGICEQSDLNRIKSLGTGSLLTESIKKVIPKSKHHRIKPLVKIQNEKYKQYLEAQNRLIK